MRNTSIANKPLAKPASKAAARGRAKPPLSIVQDVGKTALQQAKSVKTVALDPNVSDCRTHSPWFRGEHTLFNPSRAQMIPETAVQDHVLRGWLPPEPLITPATQITAFGSCFAAHISSWLAQRNFRVLTRDQAHKDTYVMRLNEAMVNSFVIRQQFEWAWENHAPKQDLWHGYDAEACGYDEDIRLQTKRIFDETDLFILTFGLSEVWYDEVSGEVFSRTIPKAAYDPSRHRFRVSSVAENRGNIEAIYQLIRKHRPDAKIIFTLSPVPLIATFRDNSCLTSNSASKAILRATLDEVVRAHHGEGALFYWPSFEIVTDVFHLPYQADRRHTDRAVLDYIMTEFEHHWCKDAANPAPPRLEAWVKACAAARLLPPRLLKLAEARNPAHLRQFIQRRTFSADPDGDVAITGLLGRLADAWDAAA